MRIAVAGGTGTVGAHVVRVARERGHTAIVLARGTGVDLVSGAGLDAALAGADAVLDVTSVSTTSAGASTDFFAAVTRNLLAAETAAGVEHHVALSIVGIDGEESGYYAGKLAQERLVAAGPVPWTLLRATQFHEFAPQMAGRLSAGPLTLVPVMRTQPVAASQVAERLVDLAEGQAQGRERDLAGPRIESLARMVRDYLRVTGSRALVLSVPIPGSMGRAMRTGALLPGPDAQLATQTYDEWLDTLPIA